MLRSALNIVLLAGLATACKANLGAQNGRVHPQIVGSDSQDGGGDTTPGDDATDLVDADAGIDADGTTDVPPPDTAPPAVDVDVPQNGGKLDPFVRRGDKQRFSVAASDESGLSTVTYAFSADGVTFGPEIDVPELSPAPVDAVIPTDAPSTAAARFRITATDAAGNVASVETPVFQVATRADRWAGASVSGLGSADGTSGDNAFGVPQGLASDGTYLYVADWQTIRRVSLASGAADTLAGVYGVAGFADGVGDAARFSGPRGVAVMGTTLYVLDSSNDALRAVNINPNDASHFREVTTVVGGAKGNVPSGAVGLSDTFANARLNNPVGIVNANGTLYIADSSNHCIRTLDFANQLVVNVAGSCGSSGTTTTTTFTLARFNAPLGMHYDAGTNALYVVSTGEFALRKLALGTSNVTTPVPTVASSAGANDATTAAGTLGQGRFRSPVEITGDGTYLYITDQNLHAIRRYELATGELTTIAGVKATPGFVNGAGATARFSRPTGIVAVGGVLYVADAANAAIRKIDLATDDVSTFAGVDAATTGYDYGAATENAPSMAKIDTISDVVTADGDTFYFVTPFQNTVRRYVASTGLVTKIAGSSQGDGGTAPTSGSVTGAAARFNVPTGLALVGSTLYVADTWNHAVRAIDVSSASFTTTNVAGTPGTAGSSDATTGTFRFPRGLASCGGYLYVADTSNHEIRRIQISGGAVSTVAGTGSSGASAAGPVNGSAATFNQPYNALCIGTTLYVADTGNDTIRTIDLSQGTFPTRTVVGGAGGYLDATALIAQIDGPRQMVHDGNGTIYFNDYQNARLRAFDTTNFVVTTVVGNAGTLNGNDLRGPDAAIGQPWGLAYVAGTPAKLYFGNFSTAQLRSVDLTTKQLQTVIGLSSNNRLPRHIAGIVDGPANVRYGVNYSVVVSDGGSMFGFDGAAFTVDQLNHDGSSAVAVAGTPLAAGPVDGTGAAARLHAVAGAAVIGSWIYFTDSLNHTVRRVHKTSHDVETVAGLAGTPGSVDGSGGAARFNAPYGLATDGSALFVADQGNGTIRRLSLAPGNFGTVTTIAGMAQSFAVLDGTGSNARFTMPTSLAFVQTPDGGELFVGEYDASVIRRLHLASAAVTTFVGTVDTCANVDGVGAAARFCWIGDLAYDEAGHLYASDLRLDTIRKIDLATQTVTTFSGKPGQGKDERGDLATVRYWQPLRLSFVPGTGLIVLHQPSDLLLH